MNYLPFSFNNWLICIPEERVFILFSANCNHFFNCRNILCRNGDAGTCPAREIINRAFSYSARAWTQLATHDNMARTATLPNVHSAQALSDFPRQRNYVSVKMRAPLLEEKLYDEFERKAEKGKQNIASNRESTMLAFRNNSPPAPH